MTIQEIYKEQEPFFEIKMADIYNSFVKRIEKNKDYTLSDDETSELFNELLLKYVYKTMSLCEWTRVIEEINK